MSLRTGQPLVQLMASRLLRAKSLSEPMIAYYQFDQMGPSVKQWNSSQIITIFIYENDFGADVCKMRPSWHGLNVFGYTEYISPLNGTEQVYLNSSVLPFYGHRLYIIMFVVRIYLSWKIEFLPNLVLCNIDKFVNIFHYLWKQEMIQMSMEFTEHMSHLI